MKHFISTTLLLLALLLPATANAYDFEVDGIYYNITSSNTVEVTYKDLNGSSYSGTVVIPTTVTCNSVSYSVTAIGDSAFFAGEWIDGYGYSDYIHNHSALKSVSLPESIIRIGKSAFEECRGIEKITIPESVISIEENAFAGCFGLSDVTCLALTPPNNNGNFEIKDFDGSFINNRPGIEYEDDLRPWAILRVPPSSYEAYKESIQWSEHFNFVIPIGAEKTDPPIIAMEIEPNNGVLSYWTITADDRCSVFCTRKTKSQMGYGDFGDYYSEYDWKEYASGPNGFVDINDDSKPIFHLEVSAFAITDGKEPSEIVTTESFYDILGWGPSYSHYIALLSIEYLNYSSKALYDFQVNGVCYNHLSGTAVEVVRDLKACGYYCNKYYYCDTFFNDFSFCYYEREGYYNGSVFIPPTVEYNGITYNVTNISNKAFTSDWFFYPGYSYMGVYTNHGSYQDIAYDDSFFVTNCNLKSITIPVSITSIADSTFWGIDLESVYITGEGEWQAGALPESVKTLYIGSGVTGVKGMKVNPEVIYSYATTPPVCDENSFTGYGAELHVPASSLAAYFTAPYWCNFTNIIGDAVAVTDLSLNQDSIEIMAGEQMTLRATVTPANAVPYTVSWITTDQSVATVENGVVTAVKGGECDIVATCQDKQAICHVVVNEILPEEIVLNQDDIKIEVGSQFTLTATVLPDNATNKTVTWKTTNSAVATVNNGVVTGVGQGECNIIASCGDKQAICHVIVVEHYIFITLNQHSASLLPNHIVSLTPTVAPVATDIVVTSSNPAVAAARLAGDKIQVVGITEGNATIYVNSADGYAFSDSCLVEVYTERGDVNCDGFVNISDGTVLIDILLGGDVNHSEDNADCNSDGKITISDLTALIDALLGGAPLPEKNYEVINVNGVSFKMMKVQGGTFTMGATPEQGTEEPWNDEWPTHEVTVSSFCIGQTEVTQELWQAVMGSNPSYFTGDPKRPVEMVSWDECQQFIATLNQLTGMNFRMPTEAEWEYAARGGNRSEGYKYAGSNDINETAWWDDNAGDGVGESSPDYGTHPVALKKANELGLYDMSGNVWEWCQDWYGTYSQETQINPTGPETGTEHLYRGGSWLNYARNCRVSCRFHWVTNGVNYVGLRLVK